MSDTLRAQLEQIEVEDDAISGKALQLDVAIIAARLTLDAVLAKYYSVRTVSLRDIVDRLRLSLSVRSENVEPRTKK